MKKPYKFELKFASKMLYKSEKKIERRASAFKLNNKNLN